MTSAGSTGRLWAQEARGDTAFLLLLGVQAGWEVELHRAGTTLPTAVPLLYFLRDPQVPLERLNITLSHVWLCVGRGK